MYVVLVKIGFWPGYLLDLYLVVVRGVEDGMGEIRVWLVDRKFGEKFGKFDWSADDGGCGNVGKQFRKGVKKTAFGVERWVRVCDAVD